MYNPLELFKVRAFNSDFSLFSPIRQQDVQAGLSLADYMLAESVAFQNYILQDFSFFFFKYNYAQLNFINLNLNSDFLTFSEINMLPDIGVICQSSLLFLFSFFSIFVQIFQNCYCIIIEFLAVFPVAINDSSTVENFIFPIIEFQIDLQYRLVQNFPKNDLEIQDHKFYQFVEESFFLLQQSMYASEFSRQKFMGEVLQYWNESQKAEFFLLQQQSALLVELALEIDNQTTENFLDTILKPQVYAKAMNKNFNLLIQDQATYQLSSVSIANIFSSMPDYSEFLYKALCAFLQTMYMFFFFFSIYDLQDITFFFFLLLSLIVFFFSLIQYELRELYTLIFSLQFVKDEQLGIFDSFSDTSELLQVQIPKLTSSFITFLDSFQNFCLINTSLFYPIFDSQKQKDLFELELYANSHLLELLLNQHLKDKIKIDALMYFFSMSDDQSFFFLQAFNTIFYTFFFICLRQLFNLSPNFTVLSDQNQQFYATPNLLELFNTSFMRRSPDEFSRLLFLTQSQQESIVLYFNFFFSFFNYTLFFFLFILLISFFLLLIFAFFFLKKHYYSVILKEFAQLIFKTILDILTHLKAKQYFLFLLFFLFVIILCCNFFGLIPYSFAITSYFSVTFFFSFIFFFALFFIGLLMHGLNLLNLFIPPGTPFLILPLLFVIEIVSYFARIFSLAIRLFANITAGHILLYIFSQFVSLLFDIFIASFIGFCLISILQILEAFISVLQAYVFVVLVTLYLNEILYLEH